MTADDGPQLANHSLESTKTRTESMKAKLALRKSTHSRDVKIILLVKTAVKNHFDDLWSPLDQVSIHVRRTRTR
jgi:hypothetical protein